MTHVVARFRDGRLVKGITLNFSPSTHFCHIQPADQPYGEGQRIPFADLKALFFVRDLAGNPYYDEDKTILPRVRIGDRVRVRFQDGEEVSGLANLAAEGPGFFIYPSDPKSNNERIYAIRDFVAAIDPLDVVLHDAAAAAAASAAASDPQPAAETPVPVPAVRDGEPAEAPEA